MFVYPTPYYIISALHFLGFGFINSTKILLASSFIFSGITMYIYLRSEVKSIAAFTGAIFYLFAPYHFLDLHFRASVAETLSFVFLPIIFLSINKLNKNIFWPIFLILSFAGLILTHQAITLSFTPIIILYFLFKLYNINDRKNFLRFI